MLINDVCRKTDLTKKAVEYYESKELIAPAILENGYRNYSDKDVAALKEISVLRKCGVAVAEIKGILESANKPAALQTCKYLMDTKIQRLLNQQERVQDLIDDYDVEREFAYFQSHDEDIYTIKEKLVLAFPGNYGLFLSLHFGRFLDVEIDTDEKRAAYKQIIQYLDGVNFHMPSELSEYLQSMFDANEQLGAAPMQSAVRENMTAMLEHTGDYLERHRAEIEEYLVYRASDAYKSSPAAHIHKMMRDFQNASGYHEKLVGSIKILSPVYREYLQNIDASNEMFLQAFPGAEDILA